MEGENKKQQLGFIKAIAEVEKRKHSWKRQKLFFISTSSREIKLLQKLIYMCCRNIREILYLLYCETFSQISKSATCDYNFSVTLVHKAKLGYSWKWWT